MRLAVSVTSATGSTTLLMKTMLETKTMAATMRSSPAATPTVSRISLCTADMEVTYRMAPTTWSLRSRGAQTLMTCSPVLGSTPRKDSICRDWKTPLTSGVPGTMPEVRP